MGLILTFFCAGTPSTRGTLDLVKALDVPLEEVTSLRYRGEGWPGRFKIRSRNGTGEKSFSYVQAWGRLTDYKPLRCNLCPDGLGWVADISCGDAWERLDSGQDAGRSIVVVRTRRGQEILHKAMAAKYVELEPVGASAVVAAQPSQIGRNREIFGRLLGMRLFFIPTPRFVGFSLIRAWWGLPILGKMRTIFGTIRRVVTRGWWRRLPERGRT
jgi:coenzyme F420 hydrogenase subunit beta